MMRIAAGAARRRGRGLALALGLMLSGCGDGGSPVAPPAPYRVLIAGGDDQSAPAGELLEGPIAVRVVALDGTAIPHVLVEWRILEGGGAVTAAASETDSAGYARISWRLGSRAGLNLAMAHVEGATPATFRAVALLVFRDVVAGFRHSCALSLGGAAYCWGDNSSGQLGTGSYRSGPDPGEVSGHVFSVLVAGWSHSCGLDAAGGAFCWGNNEHGQLGIGSTQRAVRPVAVAGGLSFRELAAGYLHTCGVTVGGELYCWGSQHQQQLGVEDAPDWCGTADAATPCSQVPRRVVADHGFLTVSAGEFHTCAIAAGGQAFCWGSNDWGELGIGVFGGTRERPAPLAAAIGFDGLSAGTRHSCGTALDGRGYCWGMNGSGALGDGTPLNRAEPSPVALAEPLRVIGIGGGHGCGLDHSGTAYCWGTVLGDGTRNSSLTPVRVPAEVPFSALAVGWGHSCALGEGIWCWGDNSHGQAGVPVATSYVEGPTKVWQGR
jgi:alpha-tubulin suppressor-like RCC1 family protein